MKNSLSQLLFASVLCLTLFSGCKKTNSGETRNPILSVSNNDFTYHVNDRVINAAGEIAGIISFCPTPWLELACMDGYAVVNFGHGNVGLKVSEIIVSVPSVGRFAPHDRAVIDSNGNIGTIAELFSDGRARIGFYRETKAPFTSIQNVKTLGLSYACVSGQGVRVCSLDDLWVPSLNGAVKVMETFDSGYARVQYKDAQGVSQDQPKSFAELGLAFTCKPQADTAQCAGVITSDQR